MIKILTSRLARSSAESAARSHRTHSTLEFVMGSSVLMFGIPTGASILTGVGVTELIIMRVGHYCPVARGGVGEGQLFSHVIVHVISFLL